MHSEVQAAGDEVLQAHLKLVEVGPQRLPAVDHQENVAVSVVGLPLGAHAPVCRHRFDSLGGEVPLAVIDDRLDLSEHAADAGFVASQGDAGHMGEVPHSGERAAAEVHRVDLDLHRRVGQRQRADDGSREGRFSGLRAADDCKVASRAGEVEGEYVPALFERAVDVAHGDRELAGAAPLRRMQAEDGRDAQIRHEAVERGRNVERRQPHLVGVRPLARHPRDGDVEGGVRHPGDAGVAELVLLRPRILFDLLDLLGLQAQRLGGEVEDLHILNLAGSEGGAQLRPLGRRPGNVGGAESDEPAAGVGLEVSDAGDRGELVGLGAADNAARLLRGERAQADAV